MQIPFVCKITEKTNNDGLKIEKRNCYRALSSIETTQQPKMMGRYYFFIINIFSTNEAVEFPQLHKFLSSLAAIQGSTLKYHVS